jgi:hypothetical protein
MSSDSGLGMRGLVDAIDERMRSPVYGTFMIFFVVWNWADVAFFLRSDLGIEAVVSVLQSRFSFCYQVGVPLLGTIFYLLSYPWVQDLANWYRQIAELKMAEKMAKTRKATLQAKMDEVREHDRLEAHTELGEIKDDIAKAKAELEQIKDKVDSHNQELESQKEKTVKMNVFEAGMASDDNSYDVEEFYMEGDIKYPVEADRWVIELASTVADISGIDEDIYKILSAAVKQRRIASASSHSLKILLKRFLEMAPTPIKNVDAMVDVADQLQADGGNIVEMLDGTYHESVFDDFLSFLASAVESLREIQRLKE